MLARARDPGAAGAAGEPRPLTEPTAALVELTTRVVGSRPERWRRVAGGQTHAETWSCATHEGSRFVKAAFEDSALRALRAETDIFRQVSGSFMPAFHGWAIEDGVGVLLIEDLSEHVWPPPYPQDPTPLFDALAAVARFDPPPGLPRLGRVGERESWRRVSEDPTPLASLTGWTPEWLAEVAPALSAAEERCVVQGDRLVHNDVWSGNVCFDDGRAVLVDWAVAAIGNPDLDVAYALVSVRAEGGVTPELDVPQLPELMSLIAGHHAAVLSAPVPTWVHETEMLLEGHLTDLRVALPWAVELLGLPTPEPG